LAIMNCGNGEELVDVVDVVVLSSEVALVEAVAVWFPPCCVTVTVDVLVFVTVGGLVWASRGDGGLAGEKSDLVTEAMPAIMVTRLKVRPALNRFLRVMLWSCGDAPCGWDASFFWSLFFSGVNCRTSPNSV